jgi:hypothetical protein
VNHNKLITEELKAITDLMLYDRSKTLSENIQEQGQSWKIPAPTERSYQDNLRPQYYDPVLRDFGSYENKAKWEEQMMQKQMDDMIQLYYLKKKPTKPIITTTGNGYLNTKGQHLFKDGEKHWSLPYLSPRLIFKQENGEVYDIGKYFKNYVWSETPAYYSSDKYREILQDIYELDYNDWNSLYGPKAKNKEAHKILGYGELILAGIGIIASIVAAIPSGGATLTATAALVSSYSLGLALTAGLADAALYYQEGDTYSALMAGALTLIPGDELFKIMKVSGKLTGVSLPILKNILKVPDDLLPIIKKARNGLDNLTADELQAYLTFQRATLLNSALIGKESLKYSFKAAKNALKELPFGKKIFNLLDKSSGFIKAGATAYSIDQIWLMYSIGKNLDAEKRRKLRSNILTLPNGEKINLGSDFGTLMDYAYENGIGPTIKMIGVGLWDMIWKKDGNPNKEGREEISKGLDGDIDNLPENEKDLENYKITDKDSQEYDNTLGDIKSQASKQFNAIMSFRSGHEITVNMLKNGKGTIQKGDQGNSTKYVQELLSQIKNPDGDNYDLGTSGTNKDGIDADFGESTEESVIDFQIDYVFNPETEKGKIDGVVGKETINKMEEILKQQKNEG